MCGVVLAIHMNGLNGSHSREVSRQIIGERATEDGFSTANIASDYCTARHSWGSNGCEHPCQLLLIALATDDFWGHPVIGKGAASSKMRPAPIRFRYSAIDGSHCWLFLKIWNAKRACTPDGVMCKGTEFTEFHRTDIRASHCFSPSATSSSNGVISGLA